jgi:hypothetical protein
MTRTQFDTTFSSFQLSELLASAASTRKVKKFLGTFACSRNPDLQDFLHNNALIFEKHLRSRTYLYVDNDTKEVAAYFTIAISTLHTEGISKEVVKLLDGYKDDTKTIPCFLIGQLGKSDRYVKKKIGVYMLEDAIEIIDAAHAALGGRFILLDAINNAKVIAFYEENSFFRVENDSKSESLTMIRPYYEEME